MECSENIIRRKHEERFPKPEKGFKNEKTNRVQ